MTPTRVRRPLLTLPKGKKMDTILSTNNPAILNFLPKRAVLFLEQNQEALMTECKGALNHVNQILEEEEAPAKVVGLHSVRPDGSCMWLLHV